MQGGHRLAAATKAAGPEDLAPKLDTVTVTDIHIGDKADIVDGMTVWTLAKAQDGVAGSRVKGKAAGASIVSCAVLPS